MKSAVLILLSAVITPITAQYKTKTSEKSEKPNHDSI